MEPLNIFDNSFLNEGFKVYTSEDKTKKYVKHNVFSNVIKQLIFIYGEETMLSLFNQNDDEKFAKIVSQYGFCKDSIQKWLNAMEAFYRDNKKPNYFFELIQEGLIDMYIYKVKSTKDISDRYDFEKLIYVDNSPNLIIRLYNLLYNKNIKSINEYWKNRLFELYNPIEFKEVITYLSDKQYEDHGLTLEEVKRMSKEQIDKINKKIIVAENSSDETSGGRTNIPDNNKKLVLAAN